MTENVACLAIMQLNGRSNKNRAMGAIKKTLVKQQFKLQFILINSERILLVEFLSSARLLFSLQSNKWRKRNLIFWADFSLNKNFVSINFQLQVEKISLEI